MEEKIKIELDGIVLENKAIVPGLSFHDLVMIYERAFQSAKPGMNLLEIQENGQLLGLGLWWID
jgi:hypothetical protein